MPVNPGSAESLAWSWVHYFCSLHFTSANIPGAVARKGQPSPPTAEYLVICRGQWDKTLQTTASGRPCHGGAQKDDLTNAVWAMKLLASGDDRPPVQQKSLTFGLL